MTDYRSVDIERALTIGEAVAFVAPLTVAVSCLGTAFLEFRSAPV